MDLRKKFLEEKRRLVADEMKKLLEERDLINSNLEDLVEKVRRCSDDVLNETDYNKFRKSFSQFSELKQQTLDILIMVKLTMNGEQMDDSMKENFGQQEEKVSVVAPLVPSCSQPVETCSQRVETQPSFGNSESSCVVFPTASNSTPLIGKEGSVMDFPVQLSVSQMLPADIHQLYGPVPSEFILPSNGVHPIVPASTKDELSSMNFEQSSTLSATKYEANNSHQPPVNHHLNSLQDFTAREPESQNGQQNFKPPLQQPTNTGLLETDKSPNHVFAPSFPGIPATVGGAVHMVPPMGHEIPKFELIGSQKIVTVIKIFSPWNMWVQPDQYSNSLEDLLALLETYHRKLKPTDSNFKMSMKPKPGMIVCAQYTDDDAWYRARVLAVRKVIKGERKRIEAEVLFVDYGNCELLPLKRLRPLPLEFAQLPMQAFCCSLSRVAPLNRTNSWSTDFVHQFSGEVMGKDRSDQQAVKMHFEPNCPLVFVDMFKLPRNQISFNSENFECTDDHSVLRNMMNEGKILSMPDNAHVIEWYNGFAKNSCSGYPDMDSYLTNGQLHAAQMPILTPQVPNAIATETLKVAAPYVGCSVQNMADCSNRYTPSCVPVKTESPVLPPQFSANVATISTTENMTKAGSGEYRNSESGQKIPAQYYQSAEHVNAEIDVGMDSGFSVPPSEIWKQVAQSWSQVQCMQQDDFSNGNCKSARSHDLGESSSKLACDRNSSIQNWLSSSVVDAEEMKNAGLELRDDGCNYVSGCGEEMYAKANDANVCMSNESKKIQCSSNSKPAKLNLDLCVGDQNLNSNIGGTIEKVSLDASLTEKELDIVDRDKLGPRYSPVTMMLPEDLEDYTLEISVSTADSPGKFWVHLINEDALMIDDITEEVNKYCRSVIKVNGSLILADIQNVKMNSPCLVKSPEDNCFYRALVLNKSFADKKFQIKVLYVDFGGTDFVDQIFDLPQYLVDLSPPMAICCRLWNLLPSKSVWSEESKALFRSSVMGYDKRLVAYLGDNYHPGQKVCPTYERPLQVLLNEKDVDGNGVEKTNCINLDLIERGYAIADHQDLNSPGIDLSWNPMAEDYLSARNSYQVDQDDPGMAAVNYTESKERTVCTFFNTRAGCWHGDNCRFEHVFNTDTLTTDKKLVFGVCDTEMQLDMPAAGSWLPVQVTTMWNPTRFYIIFPHGMRPLQNKLSGEDDRDEDPMDIKTSLEALMESLNHNYQNKVYNDTDLTCYACGEIVAVRYTETERWHRAKIINDPDNPDGKIQVFYVDYGNEEWVAIDRIRQMESQFMHLPFQAVECRLPVSPSSEDGNWSQDAKNCFESLVRNEVLVARVLSEKGGVLLLSLYNTYGEHVNIEEALVEKGYAVRSENYNVGRDSDFNSDFKSSSGVETLSGSETYIPG